MFHLLVQFMDYFLLLRFWKHKHAECTQSKRRGQRPHVLTQWGSRTGTAIPSFTKMYNAKINDQHSIGTHCEFLWLVSFNKTVWHEVQMNTRLSLICHRKHCKWSLITCNVWREQKCETTSSSADKITCYPLSISITRIVLWMKFLFLIHTDF